MSMENIKAAVNFGLTASEVLFAISEKNSKLSKAACLLPLLENVPALLKIDFHQMGEEIKALTPEQINELNDFIHANFSIEDADKERVIELSVDVVMGLARIVDRALRAVVKPKPEEVVDASPSPDTPPSDPAVPGSPEGN